MAEVFGSPRVARLLTFDVPEPLDEAGDPTASVEFVLGDIEELIALACLWGAKGRDESEATFWAPVYAWRALGRLKAESAIAPLVKLLGAPVDPADDYRSLELVAAIAKIGPAAILDLEALMFDVDQDVMNRADAGYALAQMSARHPAAKEACLAPIRQQLADTRNPDADLNAFLTANLIEVGAMARPSR